MINIFKIRIFIKILENYIYNSYIIQFVFNNINIINILLRFIIYYFTNIFTMMLGYFYTLINTCYNKYRFDKLENTVYNKFNNKFQTINGQIINIKEKITDIDNHIEQLKNENKKINDKLDLILQLLDKKKYE